MSSLFWVFILLGAPFLGFLINGVRYRSSNVKLSGWIGTSAIFISFLSALFLLKKLYLLEPSQRVLEVYYFDWIHVGDFISRFRFLVDPLSISMVLVITGVGTLIHLFSIGYMSSDNRPSKYFAYLNFFIFNMLILVLADNFLLMFAGWEGVGLSSYLLIGFWFTDHQKAVAGMKAFVINRIGDVGFLIGLFILFSLFKTVDFAELSQLMPSTPEINWTSPISLACLFLFFGACGKSAQIPLYVWLPDAMAGPTPVSALIHAATMVTAGVYMVVRLNIIFLSAPLVMYIIALTGALTALFAATIAITQWDIKKVLAYSTISQLGYMFLIVGVGHFTLGIFHLITHAFFKALLFLGAGSIIHSLHHEQDLRKMGGLRKKMPVNLRGLFYWLAFYFRDSSFLWVFQ